MTGRKRSFVLGAVAFVIVLVIIEVSARIAWSLFASPQEAPKAAAWFVYAADVGWKPRPNYEGSVYWDKRHYDDGGLLAGDYRPQAPYRIVTIGDSCTFGYGLSDRETYASQLEARLDSVDVVNISAPGYTSYQGARLLDRALALEPDLVVVAFGFNDRRYVVDSRSVDGAPHFRRVYWSNRIAKLSRYYYTYRSIAWIVARARSHELATIDVRTASARVEVDRYRDNMQRIASGCRERGVSVVFLLFGDNPDVAAPVREGRARVAAGELEDATESFWRAVRLNFLEMLARRHLARVYTDLKNPLKADEVARVPGGFSLHGGGIVRDEDDYHNAIIEVAAQSGGRCVDMREAFARDTSVYLDVVHFDHRAHVMIARHLKRAIEDENLLGRAGR